MYYCVIISMDMTGLSCILPGGRGVGGSGGRGVQHQLYKCELITGTSLIAAFQCKRDAECLNNGKCTNCSPGFKATCDCALGYIGANCGK